MIINQIYGEIYYGMWENGKKQDPRDSQSNRFEEEWLDGGKIIFEEPKQFPAFTLIIPTLKKSLHMKTKNPNNFQLPPLPNLKYLKRKKS